MWIYYLSEFKYSQLEKVWGPHGDPTPGDNDDGEWHSYLFLK